MKKKFKTIFITGLAVVIPAGLTIYILIFLIDTMDGFLSFIPANYHPGALIGFRIPGIGIIITVILIFICGLIVKTYFGNKIVVAGENLVDRIPFVRSIYNGIKQVSDSMFMDKRSSFKKVVLVEFPRKGIFTIGFVTGKPSLEIRSKIGQDCISVFIPTTPNPTSGYLVLISENESIPMSMSVEEALTYIISVGIVTPSEQGKEAKKYFIADKN